MTASTLFRSAILGALLATGCPSKPAPEPAKATAPVAANPTPPAPAPSVPAPAVVPVDAGPSGFAAREREVLRQELAKMNPALKPPATYVAKDVCPFECCSYRAWTATEDVPLVDTEHGTKVVGTVKKGDVVSGVTGNVYVTPLPARALVDEPPFKKGDVYFVLDYQGEGNYRYWLNGGAAVEPAGQWDEPCTDACKVVFLEPLESLRSDWWAQLKLKDGTVGWTNKTKSFDRKDSCD